MIILRDDKDKLVFNDNHAEHFTNQPNNLDEATMTSIEVS